MTVSIESILFDVIGDQRFLGRGPIENPIEDPEGRPIRERFLFFAGKKRCDKNRFVQVKTFGKQVKKIDVVYHYMLDQYTKDLYLIHSRKELLHNFLITVMATPFFITFSFAWNCALIVLDLFKEVFKEVKTLGLIDYLNGKEGKKFENSINRFRWIKTSLMYGVAIELVALNALFKREDFDNLLAMKVVIGRLEYLWNRKQDFRHSCFTQLEQFNKGFAKRLSSDLVETRLNIAIDLLKKIDYHTFTSVFYIMQCFQSRGKLTEEITKGVRKFEVFPNSTSFYYPQTAFSQHLKQRRLRFNQRTKVEFNTLS